VTDKPHTAAPDVSEAPPVEAVGGVEAEDYVTFDRHTVEELVERTSELLSAFDRELKYEMQDEAGVVQIQVIDSRDGRIVRKIPADEVIKIIEHIRAQIDDRVDVWA
jgi:uncharacterized FlaG/YvyC family protein